MNGIHTNLQSVLLCSSAVEGAVSELLATAESMKAGLEHLAGICSGPQFESLKPEVVKEVEALRVQATALKSKAIPELKRIEVWIRKGNGMKF